MIDRPFRKGDPVQEQLMHQAVRQLEPGWYDVTFAPKARAATAARGYLHGCVIPIYAAYCGECENGVPWPDDEAWDRCKRQFRPREYIDPVTGSVEVVGRSTKGMKPLEIFLFTELVRDWLEGQGVAVPLPDPKWREAKAKAQREATAEQRKSA